MPPRPRPRPRPQYAASSPTHAEASSSTVHLGGSKKETEDEDSLFMRNRGRSLKDINRRAALAAATAPQTSSPTGSDDEEEDDDETPKRGLGKNRKHNTQGKTIALPKWTKKGALLKMLGDSDSESENNHPSAYDSTPSKRRRDGNVSTTGTPTGRRGERMRARSRSRSLTPPPDLTLAQKISAQQAIKNALKSENLLPVAKSIVVVEDDNDGDGIGVELDPALQYIAQSLAAKRSETGDFGSAQMARPDMPHHSSSGGPPEVSVHVKWVPHPEDEVMQARPQQSWTFIVKRHQSLKQLLSQISDKAHVLTEDLVLMRDGKRVFTGVSPDGLGAWDQVDLEVCDRETFEELHERPFRSPTPVERPAEQIDYDRGDSAAPSEASADHEGADNKFKIVLRAKGSKEVTLTVRPTTSCGKIVRAFLAVVAKHGGPVPTSPRKAAQVRLCVDGEKQDVDTPIADCDLEDGDMVEVVGM